MNTENKWTAWADAKPESNRPFWVGGVLKIHPQTQYLVSDAMPLFEGRGYTHWRYADVPEAPKEPTQAERDVDAWSGFYRSDFGHSKNPLAAEWRYQFRAYYLAGVAHERAEIAALLRDVPLTGKGADRQFDFVQTFAKIAKRLGLTEGGGA